jgi:hypothetical protein
LGLEQLEMREVLSAVPVTGINVVEHGVQSTSIFADTTLVSDLRANLNPVLSQLQSGAVQQLNAISLSGYQVEDAQLTLPTLTNANSSLTATVHKDQSVQLDFNIQNVTGSLAVSIPYGLKLAAASLLYGPIIAPFAAAGLDDPSFSVTADIDLRINLPSPTQLAKMEVTASNNHVPFALPAGAITMQADHLNFSGTDTLGDVVKVINSIVNVIPQAVSFSPPPVLTSQITPAVGIVASALETTKLDGGTKFEVFVNRGGVLTYQAEELHTFHVIVESLTPKVPSVTDKYSPVTALATCTINDQLAPQPKRPAGAQKNQVFVVTSSSNHGKVSIDLTVQNVSQPTILFSGHVVKVNGHLAVKWSTGQTNQFIVVDGYWAVKAPDGSTEVTGYSTDTDPALIPAAVFTKYTAAPPGTQLGARHILLTYNVADQTITGTTSDGFSVSGVAGKTITVVGGPNMYPSITFTVGMN